MRAFVLLAMLAACRPSSAIVAAIDAQASPQAAAEPVAIASAVTKLATTPMSLDAGPPPETLRGDEPITADLYVAPARDAGLPVIYTLSASLRALEAPAFTRAPEVSLPVLESARKRLDPHLTIDLDPSRMRAQLTGAGWLVPPGWELRARADRYGHALVEPGLGVYRVLAPGAVRAFLGERRLDVAPAAPALIETAGEGTRRLGLKTRRVALRSRSATATFELAQVDGCGNAGALLSRLLLELISAPPSTPLARADEIPLHAEVRWTSRRGLLFEATSLSKRTDPSGEQLLVPPPSAVFSGEPLPRVETGILLSATELSTLHSSATQGSPQASATSVRGTLSLANGTDALRVAWLDGVPAAWLAPRGRTDLDGLMRGRYQLDWRTFLNDDAEPSVSAFAPGASELGGSDSGRPAH